MSLAHLFNSSHKLPAQEIKDVGAVKFKTYTVVVGGGAFQATLSEHATAKDAVDLVLRTHRIEGPLVVETAGGALIEGHTILSKVKGLGEGYVLYMGKRS